MTEQKEYEVAVEHDLLGAYKALAAQSGQYKTAATELFDNAFDKDARCVTMTLDKAQRRFSVQDDGVGTAHLELFVGLGKRKETKENRLGRYGWGAKHALLFIAHDVGCLLNIESVCDNVKRSMRATFEQIGTQRTVKVTESALVPNAKRGTTIRLIGIRRPHIPSGKVEIGKLCAELGFTYSLAIDDQRVLIIDELTQKRRERHLVTAYQPPKFSAQIVDEFEVDKRRAVRLHVGLVAPGEQNDRPGLHYRFGYRVVEASSSKGCNGYAVSRIFGYVDLIGDWKLSALKDEVYDPGTLHAEVLSRIEGLLKAAQNQLMLAESAELIAKVEDRVNEALKNSKGKRGRGTKKGARKPTGRGSEHSDAENKQPGAKMPGDGQRGAVHIDFAELSTDAVGDFPGNTIRLNSKLEAVRRWRADGNADAIFSNAMAIYFMTKEMPMFCPDVLLQMGRAVASVDAALDGKRLSSAKVKAA